MAACCMGFVNPSAILEADGTRTMFEMSFISKPFLAAATSNIKRFSDVRLPLEMISNMHFESVMRSSCKHIPVSIRSSETRMLAESKRYENAMTSAAMAER